MGEHHNCCWRLSWLPACGRVFYHAHCLLSSTFPSPSHLSIKQLFKRSLPGCTERRLLPTPLLLALLLLLLLLALRGQ